MEIFNILEVVRSSFILDPVVLIIDLQPRFGSDLRSNDYLGVNFLLPTLLVTSLPAFRETQIVLVRGNCHLNDLIGAPLKHPTRNRSLSEA